MNLKPIPEDLRSFDPEDPNDIILLREFGQQMAAASMKGVRGGSEEVLEAIEKDVLDSMHVRICIGTSTDIDTHETVLSASFDPTIGPFAIPSGVQRVLAGVDPEGRLWFRITENQGLPALEEAEERRKMAERLVQRLKEMLENGHNPLDLEDDEGDWWKNGGSPFGS